MRYARAAVSTLALTVVGLAGAGAVHAQPAGSAPTIAIDRASVRPGERVLVTLAGWKAQVVTLSVCGNLAKRGSADCNMAASQAVGLSRGQQQALAQFSPAGPPTNCPCLIRASSPTQDEVALVPVDLVGAPVGPVVDPAASAAIDVSMTVRSTDAGVIDRFRAAFGGRTTFQVYVSVRNLTSQPLQPVTLAGTVSRGGDRVGVLDLGPSGVLAPGVTATRSAVVTLRPPVLGRFEFAITASGVAAPEHATTTTRIVPRGLAVCGAILVVDLLAIAGRALTRRRARAHTGRHEGRVRRGPRAVLPATADPHLAR